MNPSGLAISHTQSARQAKKSLSQTDPASRSRHSRPAPTTDDVEEPCTRGIQDAFVTNLG